MIFLTEGYELTTAISNIFLFIIGIIGFINIKKKLWKDFYFFVMVDAFLGVIVHGIKMSTMTNNIFWVFLSILFTFTVNTLLCIFMKLKLKHGIILSVLLSVLLLVELVLGLDYILTFTFYIILIILISIYYLLKLNHKRKYYFLFGFINALLCSPFLIFRIDLKLLDHNAISHLFTFVSLLIFYIAIKKNEN